MDNVIQWLNLNATKTKFVIFRTNLKIRAVQNSSLFFGDKFVEGFNAFKHLGMIFDGLQKLEACVYIYDVALGFSLYSGV